VRGGEIGIWGLGKGHLYFNVVTSSSTAKNAGNPLE